MKNLMDKVSAKVTARAISASTRSREARKKLYRIVAQKRGEGFVDTALKILISVVIGALLLAGLYALFNNTVLPTLVQRVKDLFNYEG